MRKEGVGYSTIFVSSGVKYELSVGGKVLRKTRIQDDKNILYWLVEDPETRDEIEYRSENWFIKGRKENCAYWILEQRDAYNNLLGHIKIIEKRNARVEKGSVSNRIVRIKGEKWFYYKKKEGG